MISWGMGKRQSNCTIALVFLIPQINFRPEDRPQDDAKPEETHQGATTRNRKLSFSLSPY